MNKKEYLSKENVEFVWDLSLVQKGIFTKLDENKYNGSRHPAVNVAFSVDSDLDIEALRHAWQQIVARTGLLRSVFRKARNRTVQVVLKEYPSPFEVIELEGSNGDFSRLVERRLITANDLDLMEGPTAGLTVFRQKGEHTAVLLNCHQAVCDRGSLLKVMEDFWNLYKGLTNGGAPAAGERPSYKLYLDWLNQQYWAPVYGFWQKELERFEAPSTLLKFHRFQEEDRDPEIRRVTLPPDVGQRLSALAGRAGVSATILVQAAWGLLLEMYNRDSNVSFGVEFGKHSAVRDLGELLGPLSNTLPMLLDIDSGMSVLDYLCSVYKKHKELETFSYVPLEEIQSNVPLLKEMELFESVVSVDETGDSPDIGGFQFWQGDDCRFRLHVNTGSRWELSLLSCGAAPARFLDQVLNHFSGLLGEMSIQGDVPLCNLGYVPLELEAEATQQSVEMDFPYHGRFMHELLEDVAAQTPDTVACVLDDYQCTYGMLNRKANRLAHWLLDHGLERDDRVVIFCRRSIEMLTSILGVFKAGGAYIPLDIKDPDSRLTKVLTDSRAKFVLSAAQHKQRLETMAAGLEVPPEVVCFDEGIQDDCCPDNPQVSLEPEDLAYIIYTSGSTGVPKGAMVEHKGMMNHLWTKIQLLEMDRSSRVAQNASHCFDISVWQFLSALIVGGSTLIFGNDVAMDPEALIQCTRKYRVTILEMVPAVIDMVLAGQEGNDSHWELPDIRFMLSTGEALPVNLCRRWLRRYPGIPVVNAYGPTECSDDTHHKIVSHVDQLQWQSGNVVLGEVIPNFQCFVVDTCNRLLPKGCAGEICLAGTGVGRGYLNDPAKTQSAFIRNRQVQSPYPLVYRTGDLGYFDHDDDLVFLGRIDFQVKIRGHRIELGEIASQLKKHEAVKRCVAVSRKDSHGQDMIVAYVVAAMEFSSTDLREYLLERLPEYMVPAHIVELKDLPLNRNGKLDLKALPDPGDDQRGSSGYTAPSTPLETDLAAIWEEILEMSPIGVDANFFELGGHSLKVIQMRSRINQKFGIDLTVTDLFKKQTVRELAAFIQSGTAASTSAEDSRIPRLDEAPFYPMSHSQQRLFFIQQLEPQNRSYNMPTAMELENSFDVSACRRALAKILERHQTLRTTFGLKDGAPVQMPATDYQLPFTFEDYSHMNEADQQAALDQWARTQAEYVFDLEQGPLFYAAVIQLAEKRFVLFFNMHHIVGDFWSWEIFFNEFFAYYKDFAAGREPEIPELPIQYSDYSAWQAQRIQEGGLEKQRQFWQEHLAGELSQLELPLDFPRPKLQTFEGEVVSRPMPAAVVERGRDVFAQAGVTPFIGYMTVYIAFLHRLTGLRDIVTGTVEAGRNRMELEDLIGFFVNTLPIRARWQGDPSFRDFLGDIRQLGMEIFQHADYPFDLILDSLDLPRDLSRHPLIGVLFQLNQDNSPAELFDMPLRLRSLPEQFINFDLHTVLVEHGGGMDCRFTFNKSLFKKETAERWIEHFIVFCSEVLANPEQPFATVPIMSEPQRQQLLIQWNDTRREFPDVINIYQLFSAQADRTPDAAGLVFRDKTVSYDCLRRRSTRLALALRDQGVDAGMPVGIYLERGDDMVVAVLAALRSGAFYIPFDPAFPAERLRYMAQDSGVRAMMVAAGRAADCPLTGLDYVETGAMEEASSAEWPGDAAAGERAYLIYTSGSTGNPKGVEISHRSLANFTACMSRVFGLDRDIFLAVTSLSFDIAFLECFVPLTAGSKVAVAAGNDVWDGGALTALAARECATIMQATPATWKLMLHHGWRGSRNLTCLVGGEAVPLDMAARLAAANKELWNMYGPTEATIWCAVHKFPREVRSVSIGKPLDNTRLYILNSALQPVPIGVTGQLYVGGDCLALGYWNAEAQTAEKFIADPFSQEPGARLYNTGDLARWLDDGTIEFIGRSDHQVKVRGYRIELGEIEAELSSHRAVQEVVVSVEEEEGGDKRITAYILFKPGLAEDSLPGLADLRAHLAGRLPRYMIPGRFLKIPVVPLTPNGKIDRNQLPSLGESLAGEGDGARFVPAGHTEEIIARAWREVLGVQEIGVDDSFFDLGGHSLKAMQLVARLAAEGISTTVNDLFRFQSIREFAVYVGGLTAGETKALTTVEAVEREFAAIWGVNCRLAVYNVEQRRFLVLYIQRLADLDRDAVANFLREKADSAVSPHYLRDLSEAPAKIDGPINLTREEFLTLLTIDASPADVASQAAEIAGSGWDAMNQTIVSGPVRDHFPLAPVQRFHLTFENRFTNSLLFFDRLVDVSLMERALTELINRQGLLRCGLAPQEDGYMWREFAPVHAVTLPLVDLRGLDPLNHDGFIRGVLGQLPHPYKMDGNSILYRVVLFRLNQREHVLALSFDHAIFDGMSGDIIRRRLYDYYLALERNQSLDSRMPRPYKEFVDRALSGPAGIDEDALIDTFGLQEFFYEGERYVELMKRRCGGKQLSAAYLLDSGADSKLSGEEMWRRTFLLFNRVMGRYFESRSVPATLVSYGRSGRDGGFYDTVGEFVDLVPMINRLEDPPEEMLDRVRRRLDTARDHNINFLGLSLDPKLKQEWRRASALCSPGSEEGERFALIFNFVGEMPEGASVDWYKPIGQGGGPGPRRLLCEVYHNDRIIVLKFAGELALEPEELHRLLEEESATGSWTIENLTVGEE